MLKVSDIRGAPGKLLLHLTNGRFPATQVETDGSRGIEEAELAALLVDFDRRLEVAHDRIDRVLSSLK